MAQIDCAHRTRSTIFSTARLALRELLCIPGTQDDIGIRPVLQSEKRIAPNRNLGIGLGDLVELHADVSLARIRAHGFRECELRS
jgi:hypothetical protein